MQNAEKKSRRILTGCLILLVIAAVLILQTLWQGQSQNVRPVRATWVFKAEEDDYAA